MTVSWKSNKKVKTTMLWTVFYNKDNKERLLLNFLLTKLFAIFAVSLRDCKNFNN